MYYRAIAILFITLSNITAINAAPTTTELAVWANEAIVATYTYDYKDFLKQQRVIANYFTADAWSTYSNALNTAKIPESVQKNAYYVTAVAQLPPEIHAINASSWQVTMPVLVVYKNPQYTQKQVLNVTMAFGLAANQGVRGLAITGLQTKVIEPPCECLKATN